MEKNYYQEFRELRDWADRVSEVLTSQVQPPADPVAREALSGAIGIAYELVKRAGRPISIGIVGEFSVGKSRLLNTLLELNGLLPVSGEPTTGNITALRLVAARPGQPPGPLGATVSYLSRAELSEAAKFIIHKLVSVNAENRLGYDVSPLHGYDPVSDGWETFEALARGWWRQNVTTEIRLYAWELLRLRDAMLTGAALIPDRPGTGTIVIDAAIAQEAITIGRARTGLPARFPERPVRPPLQAGDRLTAATLRPTFLLVRRLTYDFAIDPGLLTLSGLRDSNGLELLDFAGLNAVGGARDEWLCYQEIAGITAYLAVVQARRPETAVVTKFESMLEGDRWSQQYLADSRLLVANMFDEIEVPSPAALERDGLASASGELDSLLRMATVMGHSPGHIGLTSTIPDRVDPRWAEVADVLERQGTLGGEDGLAAGLRAYAADGGIERLRDTLSDLIETKAMPIIMAELTTRRARLRSELVRLRDLLAPSAGAETEADRESLLALVAEITQMAEEVQAGAARFRDPQKIEVAEAQREPGKPTELLERIRYDAVRGVYAWPQWQNLFAYVRHGKIEVPAHAGGPRQADRDPDDPPPPVDTREFVGQFTKTLSECRHAASDLATGSVREWVADVQKRHGVVRAQMADPALRDWLARWIEAAYPGAGATRARALTGITSLGWIEQCLTEALTDAQQWADGDQWADGTDGGNPFPLAPHHALPWNPVRLRTADPEYLTHPSRAHRLRHDLTEGTVFTVQMVVAMAFGVFEADLGRRISRLFGQLPSEYELRSSYVAPSAEVSDDDGADDAEAIALLDDLLSQPGAGTDEDEPRSSAEEEEQ